VSALPLTVVIRVSTNLFFYNCYKKRERQLSKNKLRKRREKEEKEKKEKESFWRIETVCAPSHGCHSSSQRVPFFFTLIKYPFLYIFLKEKITEKSAEFHFVISIASRLMNHTCAYGSEIVARIGTRMSKRGRLMGWRWCRFLTCRITINLTNFYNVGYLFYDYKLQLKYLNHKYLLREVTFFYKRKFCGPTRSKKHFCYRVVR
jgi:hypothetical protein